MIIEHLKAGKRINPIQALSWFGCNSLSQRIGDLKHKQDKNLHKKILAKKEGVLNWIIDGAKRVITNESILISDECDKFKAKFIKDTDSVALFMDDLSYESCPFSFVYLSNLYPEYKGLCADDGYRSLGKHNFGKRLEALGVNRKKDYHNKDGFEMKIKLINKIEIEINPEDEQTIIDEFTFNNPKYQDGILFGRSVRGIDRQICLVDKINNVLYAPIGILDYLLETFDPEIIDNRFTSIVEITFIGVLRNYQKSFIDKAINKNHGLMVAATGSGKTVCGLAMASRLKQRILILVKSKDLAEQWRQAIQRFTHCDSGLIGGGKSEEGEFFTIGLVQTMVKRDLSEFDYGLVICDEAHNIPSNTAYKVINSLNAKYKYGLSATPQRRDNMEFMIAGAIGSICSEVKQNQLQGKVLPVHVSTIEIPFHAQVESWAEFNTVLVDDEQRNNIIVARAVKSSLKMGTIILCSQIRHCELLGAMCNEKSVYPLVLHGQLPTKTRSERMEKIQESMLVIGTLSLLSEGLDVPNLSALIFAAPVSASIDRDNPAATRLIQSIGRIRRPFKNKTKSYVLDFIDNCGFGVSAFNKRLGLRI